MLHAAEALSWNQQFQTRLATFSKISRGRQVVGKRMVLILQATGFLLACLPLAFATLALAQDQENANDGGVTLGARCSPELIATFDPSTLPLIASIDIETDITVFLRSGVPEELRLAALRRAWTVDPAIRDFKGLQENDWNFNDATAGFGELGPEIDVKIMLAQILDEKPSVTASTQIGEPRIPTWIVNAVWRRFLSLVRN